MKDLFHSLSCPIPAITVLVGSRVLNIAIENSDWDIAIWWLDDEYVCQDIRKAKTLRRQLAKALNTSQDKIDLIDIQQAGLAMRKKFANDGKLIYAKKTIAWMKLLTRTWWEVE